MNGAEKEARTRQPGNGMRGGAVDQRHDHAESKDRPEDVERKHRPEEYGHREAEAE